MSGSDAKNSTKNIDDKIFKEAVDDFDRFEEFFQENLRKILFGAVLIVIILIIGLVSWNIIKQAKFKASAALASASSVDELKFAINKYPSSDGIYMARLKLGTAYMKDKKFDEAKSEFEKLASDAPEVDMKGRAQLNVAYALAEMNKQQEAAEKFVEVGEMDDMPGFIKDEANLEAGRIYFNLNKMDKAKKILNLISAEQPNKFWSRQAKMIIQKIDAGIPPLEKLIASNSSAEEKTGKKSEIKKK
jgi:TolA-binding protein